MARLLTVDADDAGQRLDRYLAAHLATPRNQIQRWIRQDRVEVDGRPAKASMVLSAGNHIAWRPPPPQDPGIEPEPGALAVLHEDPDLVVIDKPAGIAVHPGAGRRAGTLANVLLHRYPEIAAVGGPGRPGIVHRLDIDTTGAMVVARTAAAYQGLSAAFAERRVEKTYLAVVYGALEPAVGRIDAPVGRHARDRTKMTVRADGRAAATGYRTLASTAGLSLVELDLESGRTHQIRVHMKAAGHPLVGDPVYGEARWRGLPPSARRVVRQFPRPALHARRLAFEHPIDGRSIAIEAPVPSDFTALVQHITSRPIPPTIA